MINLKQWVRYNHLTDTYDTRDGTKIAAGLVRNANCLADILRIASIREEQRAQLKLDKAAAIGKEGKP
jgi:hypothetical protein